MFSQKYFKLEFLFYISEIYKEIYFVAALR